MHILTRTSQLKWNELGGTIDAPDPLGVNGGMRRGQKRRDGEEVSHDNDQRTVIHPHRATREQREWFMRMEGASDEMNGRTDGVIPLNLNTVLLHVLLTTNQHFELFSSRLQGGIVSVLFWFLFLHCCTDTQRRKNFFFSLCPINSLTWAHWSSTSYDRAQAAEVGAPTPFETRYSRSF